MKTITSIALVTCMSAGAAQAATIDFGGLAIASVPGTFTEDGLNITVTADALGANTLDTAVVYDTVAGTGDPDLTGPFTLAGGTTSRTFGNAIIVQENAAVGGVFLPDDEGNGGALTFDFKDVLIELGVVSLLDVKVGTTVTLFDGLSQVVKSTTINADTGNNVNDNLYTTLDFGGAVGSYFTVNFNGSSGAIGEFEAAAVPAVPVPATLPLLLAGLGGLGVMSRRRRAQA